MSKKAALIESLAALKNMNIIIEYHHEIDPKDNNRVRWHIQYDRIQARYMRTGEVERFVEGAQQALNAA